MKSIRELIREACTRINLVPRRQAVPGDILENGYRLLKGIVQKYNYDNLLIWTQNSIIIDNAPFIHIFDEDDVLKGENNFYFETSDDLAAYAPTADDFENDVWAIVKEQPDLYYTVILVEQSYQWRSHSIPQPLSQRMQQMKLYEGMTHIQVNDVAKINSLYLEKEDLHAKLDYVAPADYDKHSSTAAVYTYTQKAEGEWLILIKPSIARMKCKLKMNYNEGIDFDLDSDLFIPDNYIELLIVALAHKLALMYPRLDDAQMTRLEQEVKVLVDNVRTPKSVDRIIEREDYFYTNACMTQQELLSII